MLLVFLIIVISNIHASDNNHNNDNIPTCCFINDVSIYSR